MIFFIAFVIINRKRDELYESQDNKIFEAPPLSTSVYMTLTVTVLPLWTSRYYVVDMKYTPLFLNAQYNDLIWL